MERCARCSSTRPAGRCGAAELPVPRARPRRACSSGPRLRGVPHRPAHRRRRAAARRGCRSSPATRSSATVRRRRHAPAPRGRPVAGLDVRRVPLLPQRAARTSASARRSPAGPRRRLRRATPSPTSATASDCPTPSPTSQAAPLLCAGLIGHRALRMTGDAAAARALRLRRRGAHRLPGRALPGPARLRLHARRRRAAQAFARELGASGPATREAPRPRSSTRRSSSLPAGELVPAALRAVAKGGVVVCARHPHERHPVVPLRDPVGRAGAALGRQPHARRRRRVPRRSPRACRCART